MRACHERGTIASGGSRKGWPEFFVAIGVAALFFALGPLVRSFGQAADEKPDPSHSHPGTAGLGEHYLMLVNTAIARQMDARKFSQFEKSPYDALAVSFSDAYDTTPPP